MKRTADPSPRLAFREQFVDHINRLSGGEIKITFLDAAAVPLDEMLELEVLKSRIAEEEKISVLDVFDPELLRRLWGPSLDVPGEWSHEVDPSEPWPEIIEIKPENIIQSTYYHLMDHMQQHSAHQRVLDSYRSLDNLKRDSLGLIIGTGQL